MVIEMIMVDQDIFDQENEYLVTFDLCNDNKNAHGYNDNYFSRDLNQLWGKIYAVLPKFDSILNYYENGYINDYCFMMELIFVFLVERICLELSLLSPEEFDLEMNSENNCNKGDCIINDVAYEMLDLKWIKDEDDGLYYLSD